MQEEQDEILIDSSKINLSNSDYLPRVRQWLLWRPRRCDLGTTRLRIRNTTLEQIMQHTWTAVVARLAQIDLRAHTAKPRQ